MTLLGESSLIHKHHTVDGKVEALVAPLTIYCSGEHSLDLVGGGAAGALVIMRVQGSKHIRVTEESLLRLLALQVSDGLVEGKGLGGAWSPNDDERGVRDCAHNAGKEVLLQGQRACNSTGKFHLTYKVIQLLTEGTAERDLIGKPVDFIEELTVLLPKLTIESHIIDHTQCHQHCPAMVIIVHAMCVVFVV